jgi:CBS domain-containing protein
VPERPSAPSAVDRPPAGALFGSPVREFAKEPPVTCSRDTTVADVARLMSRRGAGAAVVTGADGVLAGIVTDRDLRRKIVAEARDPETTSAGQVMSSPVVTMAPDAYAFEALVEMTRRDIHHLPLVEAGRLVAVVASDDLLFAQAAHPVTLAREIGRAETVARLREVAGRVTGLVRRLVQEGGTAYDVARLVAELNDRLVLRTLALVLAALATEEGAARPPGAFCWLAFGSEGRREQTLRTDQDNGLAYEDATVGDQAMAAAFYRRLGGRMTDALVEVGFPPCPGKIMGSNPEWCQPLSVWARYFDQWMTQATPEHILAASIFFDLRPLGGEIDLGGRLVDLVKAKAPKEPLFLRRMAQDVVDDPLPVGLFGRLKVERTGPRRGSLDLKLGGTRQVVGVGRLCALAQGLGETNTVDRLRAGAAAGIHTEAEIRDITGAYQHLLRLRLVHQLDQLARGREVDNHVPVDQLSRADAVLLRDALRIVAEVQERVRHHYGTDLLG